MEIPTGWTQMVELKPSRTSRRQETPNQGCTLSNTQVIIVSQLRSPLIRQSPELTPVRAVYLDNPTAVNRMLVKELDGGSR